MSSAIMEVDLDSESIARLSGNERMRSGAARAARPVLAWFDAWPSIGRSQTKIHFVGRLAFERRVRATLVVPSEERSEFPAKVSLTLRNHDPASCLVFHGPDEAFDNGHAPMLPDGAEPWANPLCGHHRRGQVTDDLWLICANRPGHGLGAAQA